MMVTKFFEIRDAATLIPVMANRLSSSNEKENKIIECAGFSVDLPHVLLTKLSDGEIITKYDAFKWSSDRTLKTAHRYIVENWDYLSSGDVIDVEFILGETDKVKISEIN